MHNSAADLWSLLLRESEVVKQALHVHGGVLLRGFNVETTDDFESAISAIQGLEPMQGFFMSERGRTTVSRSRVVLHTNTLVKTGGGFHALGDGIHSENYYSLDVPAYVAFWCKTAPRMGGETALFNLAAAYRDLDPSLQRRLAAYPAPVTNVWALRDVSARYDVSEFRALEILERAQIVTAQVSDRSYVLAKRHVLYRHPYTDEIIFSANFSRELPLLQELLAPYFAEFYNGTLWSLHRIAWRHARLRRFLATAESVPLWLRYHPKLVSEMICKSWRGPKVVVTARDHLTLDRHQLPIGDSLASALDRDDLAQLARALWRSCSVFSWRRGDVLLVDNLKMAHAGMPGAGHRVLRAMLCNPVEFRIDEDRYRQVSVVPIPTTMDMRFRQPKPCDQ